MKTIASMLMCVTLYIFDINCSSGSDSEYGTDDGFSSDDNKKESIEIKEEPNVNYVYNMFEKDGHLRERSVPVLATDRSLDLSCMDLSEIPAFIFTDLNELEELNLEGNTRIVLPENFGKLQKSLKKLNVSNCNLTSDNVIKIGTKCTFLEDLNVSNNPEIKIMAHFGNVFKSLRKLNISNCNLKYEDLVRMDFPDLEELVLNQNDLNGMPKTYEFTNFYKKNDKKTSSLVRLSVAKCKMTYDGLQALTKLHLTHLDGSFNSFYKTEIEMSYSGLKGFARQWLPDKFNYQGLVNWGSLIKRNWRNAIHRCVRAYAVLHLSGDLHPSWLKPSEIDEHFTMGDLNNSLESLNLEYCALETRQLSVILKNMKKLTKLNVCGNNLCELDENFTFLGVRHTLLDLNIGFCNLNSQSLRALSHLTQLHTLIADENYLLGFEYWDRGSFGLTLRKLSMNWTGIGDNDIVCISNSFPFIEELNVGSNTFINTISLNEAWIKSMKVLVLENCNLSQQVFNDFMKLSHLRSLNASSFNSAVLLANCPISRSLKGNLKFLSVSGSIESGKFFNPGFWNLKELALSYIDLTVSKNMENYKELTNNITISKKIKRLSITDCTIDEAAFEKLSKLQNLCDLQMHYVKCKGVTGECLTSLSFAKLKSFVTSFCKFSEKVITKITDQKRCLVELFV